MSKIIQRIVIAALLTGVAVMPAAVQAQTNKATARDRAAIYNCLKAKKDTDEPGAAACLFIVADPCLEKPEGQSTAGMADCFRRETAVWDEILNDSYARLRGALETEQKNALRSMQRAWIVSRDKTCGFYRHFYQGGTMAIPAGAACMARETAYRALYLGRFVHEGVAR